ncbi:hypothetical protein NDU88_003676 [Pleurodeles waltl]|uniref:Uncharacterized protein n=1 Tax=Pleurodeles waltl TaxID=8319 RepID=A0AAV7VGN3_PLEWA|nr:hypothetical protein NDU88_003676 [Pleurodeles waltl]
MADAQSFCSAPARSKYPKLSGRSREPLDQVLCAEQPGQPSGAAARERGWRKAAENPTGELGLRADPGEAWTWLERYRSSTTGSPKQKDKEKNTAATAQRQKRWSRSRSWVSRPRLTRPLATQSEEVKKLALQAAASLTDPDLSDGKGAGTD